MLDKCERNETDDRERDESAADAADRVGRDLGNAAADVAGLGTGLLGGLTDALDGLVGGLADAQDSKRRTRIHPWELPPESNQEGSESDRPDNSDESDEYNEDYDRIH